MWEFCIQIKKQHQKLIDFVFSRLKKEVSQIGGVVTLNEEGENVNIVLACKDYDQGRVKVFTSNTIIEAICTFYKQDFLSSKLNLPIKEGIYVNALKKALLSFDKETDAFIVSKHLELENNLNLEAFYYFKLKPLREKWSELASIANDNGYFLVSNDNFVDLLKFLVDNLEIAHGTVNVYCEGDSFKILDELDKVFEINEDEDLITSLIGLCPKHINFYGTDTESEKINLLCKIFDKRVCFKKNV